MLDDGVPRLQVRYVLWHDCCYCALVNFDFCVLAGSAFLGRALFSFSVNWKTRHEGAKGSEELCSVFGVRLLGKFYVSIFESNVNFQEKAP